MACDYLSMLQLAINHVSKKGWCSAPSFYLNHRWQLVHRINMFQLNFVWHSEIFVQQNEFEKAMSVSMCYKTRFGSVLESSNPESKYLWLTHHYRNNRHDNFRIHKHTVHALPGMWLGSNIRLSSGWSNLEIEMLSLSEILFRNGCTFVSANWTFIQVDIKGGMSPLTMK